MPGCSHPCRLCAGYTDTAHTYIHSGQTHEWVHAHACTTRTHTHVLKCIRPTWIYQVRWEAEWRYIIIHPVWLFFFFEKKKGRKTNLFTKFDTNLYPSSPFFYFFASQWFQVNHFVLTHPVTKSTSEVNRMRVPIEAQQHAMLFTIRKPRWQDDRSCWQNHLSHV